MSINRSVTLDEFRTIFDECMASLKGGRVIGKIERRIANADAEQGR